MILCLDLGGVVVRVRSTWGSCADAAGLRLPEEVRDRLVGPDLVLAAYQAGEIQETEYYQRLSESLQIPSEDAPRLHAAILNSCYSGWAEYLSELNSRGVRTGCLSNTNEAHWRTMLTHPDYQAVQMLEPRVASFLIGHNKPSLAAYEAFSAAAGPGPILFLDDTPTNLTATLPANWRGCRIDPSQETLDQARHWVQEYWEFLHSS